MTCDCTSMHGFANNLSNHCFSYKSNPRSRTPPGGGPTWAYLPYLPLERESEWERETRRKRKTSLCTCVYV